MCSIVIYRATGGDWPLVIAANRDEMMDRPTLAPGRHWPDRPHVVGGRDETAGGTWLALNDGGLVCAISNRRGSLGPAPGMRSRGELPLAALAHAGAAQAAAAMADLDGRLYRPFNLVIADSRDAFWLCLREGATRIERADVPPGVHMLTAADLDDPSSSRIRHYLPQFRAAPAPRPDEWAEWQGLLASRRGADAHDADGAMTVIGAAPEGFGTVSSSFIALPGRDGGTPVWRYAPGRPDRVAYEPVDL